MHLQTYFEAYKNILIQQRKLKKKQGFRWGFPSDDEFLFMNLLYGTASKDIINPFSKTHQNGTRRQSFVLLRNARRVRFPSIVLFKLFIYVCFISFATFTLDTLSLLLESRNSYWFVFRKEKHAELLGETTREKKLFLFSSFEAVEINFGKEREMYFCFLKWWQIFQIRKKNFIIIFPRM